MPSKIQQNKLLKQKKIVQAALELFTSSDLQDVSIQDITQKAGIAKGTFYLFFKDKYALRDYVISIESRALIKTALERLEANDIRSFEDAVIYLINQVLEQLISNPILLRLIRRNLSFGVFHEHLVSTTSEEETDLAGRFEELANACNIHYENPKLVFFMILELTGSLCYSSIAENQPAPIEEVKPALFEAIRAILATARQLPSPVLQ